MAETTDESLPRAALVMRMTAAFLHTELSVDAGAWSRAVDRLVHGSAHMATVSEKH